LGKSLTEQTAEEFAVRTKALAAAEKVVQTAVTAAATVEPVVGTAIVAG
jgi:hypothetical protein